MAKRIGLLQQQLNESDADSTASKGRATSEDDLESSAKMEQSDCANMDQVSAIVPADHIELTTIQRFTDRSA